MHALADVDADAAVVLAHNFLFQVTAAVWAHKGRLKLLYIVLVPGRVAPVVILADAAHILRHALDGRGLEGFLHSFQAQLDRVQRLLVVDAEILLHYLAMTVRLFPLNAAHEAVALQLPEHSAHEPMLDLELRG